VRLSAVWEFIRLRDKIVNHDFILSSGFVFGGSRRYPLKKLCFVNQQFVTDFQNGPCLFQASALDLQSVTNPANWKRRVFGGELSQGHEVWYGLGHGLAPLVENGHFSGFRSGFSSDFPEMNATQRAQKNPL
jgi:hypothetical protein